jgi:hypothetical protein
MKHSLKAKPKVAPVSVQRLNPLIHQREIKMSNKTSKYRVFVTNSIAVTTGGKGRRSGGGGLVRKSFIKYGAETRSEIKCFPSYAQGGPNGTQSMPGHMLFAPTLS